MDQNPCFWTLLYDFLLLASGTWLSAVFLPITLIIRWLVLFDTYNEVWQIMIDFPWIKTSVKYIYTLDTQHNTKIEWQNDRYFSKKNFSLSIHYIILFIVHWLYLSPVSPKEGEAVCFSAKKLIDKEVQDIGNTLRGLSIGGQTSPPRFRGR